MKKKKWISGIFVLMMTALLCAHVSAGSSESEGIDDALVSEASNAEEALVPDQEKAKTNDLPTGDISSDGYSNSYFGFKLALPDKSFDPMMEYVFLFSSNNLDFETDPNSPEAGETLYKCLKENGSVRAFISLDKITVEDDSFDSSITVWTREDSLSEEDILLNAKEQIPYNYAIPAENVNEMETDFADEAKKCLIWTTQSGENYASFYLFSEEYYCTVFLSGFSSLDTVLRAFEAFFSF